MHIEIQFNSSLLHHLQAFLVVWASSPNKNTDVAFLDLVLVFRECPHNAFKGGGHVGEVGDAPSDDQDFALRVDLLGHQTEDSLGVFKCLALARSTWRKNVMQQ